MNQDNFMQAQFAAGQSTEAIFAAPEVEADKTAPDLVISVRDLLVVEKEGRVVLQTQDGMPLTNAEGRPYLASELGKVLSNDGRLRISASGRIIRPQNFSRPGTISCVGGVIAGNRVDTCGKEETKSTSIDSALTRRSKTWLERLPHEERTRRAVNCMQFAMESVCTESVLRSISARKCAKTSTELIGAC